MERRYSRLFSLPGNLYVEGSPIIISAGALLKDNHSGAVIAQIKICNISNKIIKGLQVKLKLFDTAGRLIDSEIGYQYLDLNIRRNEEFGEQTPILITDKQARSFEVDISEIIFSDNSILTELMPEWESLPKQDSLLEILRDEELVRIHGLNSLYSLEKSGCYFMPKEYKDLWLCACGAVNRVDEKECNNCTKLLAKLDEETLKTECKNRLEEMKKMEEKEMEEMTRESEQWMKIIAALILIGFLIIIIASVG